MSKFLTIYIFNIHREKTHIEAWGSRTPPFLCQGSITLLDSYALLLVSTEDSELDEP